MLWMGTGVVLARVGLFFVSRVRHLLKDGRELPLSPSSSPLTIFKCRSSSKTLTGKTISCSYELEVKSSDTIDNVKKER